MLEGQSPLIETSFLDGISRDSGSRVNDGAVMAFGLNDAITFQQAIRFRHRLVVKIQVVGKLSNRRERIAREQLVAEHGSFYGYIRISQRAQIPYISIFYGLN